MIYLVIGKDLIHCSQVRLAASVTEFHQCEPLDEIALFISVAVKCMHESEQIVLP